MHKMRKRFTRFGGGGGIFTPARISGLQRWYKANSLGLTNGESITTFTDLSGNANATQADGAKKPTFVTNQLNGKAIARFDLSDDVMSFGALPLTNFTAFWVIMYPSFAAFSGTVVAAAGSPYNKLLQLDGLTFGVDFSLGNSCTFGFGDDITGVWNIHEFTNDRRHWLNGFESTIATDIGTTNTLAFDCLGLSAGITDPMGGDLAELIIYDSVLSEANRIKVRNYLSTQYAIAVV